MSDPHTSTYSNTHISYDIHSVIVHCCTLFQSPLISLTYRCFRLERKRVKLRRSRILATVRSNVWNIILYRYSTPMPRSRKRKIRPSERLDIFLSRRWTKRGKRIPDTLTSLAVSVTTHYYLLYMMILYPRRHPMILHINEARLWFSFFQARIMCPHYNNSCRISIYHHSNFLLIIQYLKKIKTVSRICFPSWLSRSEPVDKR